jgi:hypothetical protein
MTGYQLPFGKTKTRERIPVYETGAYLQQRKYWTDYIFDSIRWTSHLAAVSALSDNVRTIPYHATPCLLYYLPTYLPS